MQRSISLFWFVGTMSVSALTPCCGGSDAAHDAGEALQVGSVRVTWTFSTTEGAPVTCADVGISEAVVSVGGRPVSVRCGSPEEVLFEQLLAQSYPVIVRLMNGAAIIDERLQVVEVLGGDRSEAVFAFEFDVAEQTTGTLDLRWTINGKSPSTACSEEGATIVRIIGRLGSPQEFDVNFDCTTAFADIPLLTAGLYEVLLRLESSDGASIASRGLTRLIVAPGTITAPPVIDFSTMPLEPTRLVGLWTINSSTAANACSMVDGVDVLMTAHRVGGVSTSSSSPCATGHVSITSLGGGPLPYRVSFRLFDSFRRTLTTTTVRDVFLLDAQTTTVAVDLLTRTST